MTGVSLPMWVVYDHPIDYPDSCVARLFEGATPTQSTIEAPNLDLLRSVLRTSLPHAVVFTRAEEDDPKIVEVWL